MSGQLRIALLEHDRAGASRPLLDALRTEGACPELIQPGRLPDLPLRLRKIGDAPGLLPDTLIALARGDYDVVHAFTAQDAAVAVAWSRVGSGRPVVYTQREPLTRANVADRRLRLATLRVAVERADAVVAPEEAIAGSLRRWMAVEPRVLSPESGAEHLRLYAELARR